MPITDWLPETRPREKLIAHGASYLTDAELLAIFLRVGIVGKSAVDLANELIQHFGSLSALFNTNLSELSKIKGMGEAKFVQLQAVLEMSRRALSDQLKQNAAFSDMPSLKTFIQLQLAHKTEETLLVLFLTPALNLISAEIMATGGLTHVSLPIRDIVQRALSINAHGLILAHNHPHGKAQPSAEDIQSTQTLKTQLQPLSLHLHDHLITADGEAAYSLVEHGLL
jgi:DNA repair protein RadC